MNRQAPAAPAVEAETEPKRRESIGQTFQLVRRFGPFIRPQRTRLLTAGFATLGFVGAGLLAPWPIKLIFDSILTKQDLNGWPWNRLTPISQDIVPALVVIVGMLLAIAAVRAFFDYTVDRMTSTAGQAMAAELRRSLFHHVQGLSLGFHDRRQTGELITRMTGDIMLLRELLANAIITISSSVLVLVGMIAVMFWLDWQLTLVALAVVPVMALVNARYIGRIKHAIRTQRRREGKLAATLHETLSMIKVVQVFQREDHERRRFDVTNMASRDLGVQAAKLEAEMSRATDLVLACGTAAVLLAGVLRVSAGALTPGDLIVFTSYLSATYRPIRDLAKLSERLSKIQACGERLLELFDTKSEVHDLPNAVGIRSVTGRIEFRGVEFSYANGPRVLKGVDFEAKPGQTIALVGTTGAGKSSILNLIPRLYEVTSGAILIDGRDVRELKLASLRSHMSIVPQESVLFSASLRENISYGRLGATMEEIAEAAQAANIHDFIVSLPEGYDTVVGERGATISGGQRQRIAIARAMLRNAPILLLDEPTTGLDANTEELVMDALRTLMEGRTTFVVTHRLPLILAADQIFVMENGRIVERGSHAELLEKRGHYHRLFDLQVMAPSSSRTASELLAAAGVN